MPSGKTAYGFLRRQEDQKRRLSKRVQRMRQGGSLRLYASAEAQVHRKRNLQRLQISQSNFWQTMQSLWREKERAKEGEKASIPQIRNALCYLRF